MTPAFNGARELRFVRISSDGKEAAVVIDAGVKSDLWSLDLASGALTRLTGDGTVGNPVWSRDGSRIYFWSGRRMTMATIARDPTLRVLSRRILFEGDYVQDYDVSLDGTRLLLIELPPKGTELVVVPNWAQELKERSR